MCDTVPSTRDYGERVYREDPPAVRPHSKTQTQRNSTRTQTRGTTNHLTLRPTTLKESYDKREKYTDNLYDNTDVRTMDTEGRSDKIESDFDARSKLPLDTSGGCGEEDGVSHKVFAVS